MNRDARPIELLIDILSLLEKYQHQDYKVLRSILADPEALYRLQASTGGASDDGNPPSRQAPSKPKRTNPLQALYKRVDEDHAHPLREARPLMKRVLEGESSLSLRDIQEIADHNGISLSSGVRSRAQALSALLVRLQRVPESATLRSTLNALNSQDVGVPGSLSNWNDIIIESGRRARSAELDE